MEGLVGHTPFWRDKKVFVTGHTGFKGSWLSLWLKLLGAEITGYALEAEENSLFTAAGIAQEVNSKVGDICVLEDLKAVLQGFRPDIVFHLAAQSLVRASYTDPVATFAANLMGTVNLLEAVRHTSSVKAVVIVTSDKCYENREWLWGYREVDSLGGHDPYSASKGCAELAVSAYRRSFFTDGQAAIATARAGNVIGGGDWSVDRIVPDIMRAVSKGETVSIRNPTAVRPWQHVCDPLQGYLMLAERLFSQDDGYSDAWNFGPDDEGARSVSWLVDYLCRKLGGEVCWSSDEGPHPHEASYLKLDCSKVRARLGWRPRLNISSTLDWTVEWYNAYFKGADIRKMTVAQIVRYLDFGNKE